MRPKILLIDNYDSFTYNLVQAFLVLGATVDVYRNDAIGVEEALALDHTHLVISPGPGTPLPQKRFVGRLPDRYASPVMITTWIGNDDLNQYNTAGGVSAVNRLGASVFGATTGLKHSF
jgi:anthranilate/para-aminobenzoate synthase component II